jgi:hypothetical protein
MEQSMSDQEKKQETTISSQLDADNKKESGELSEEELKKVAGGAPTATAKPQKQEVYLQYELTNTAISGF